MKNLTFKDLRIFYLFCYNRIDFETFQNMQNRDPKSNFNYDLEKWEDFKKDPIKYMISNQGLLLFNNIKNEIIKSNYNG